jgi:hypothetical protein
MDSRAKRSSKKQKEDVLQQKIEELEQTLRYNEALLEEVYEMQDAMFPIFADLVKLISRLYKEMKIDDDELKHCIGRLKDTFVDENEHLLRKYLADNDDFTIAYT